MARLRPGIPSRSIRPKMAAARAPTIPRPISQYAECTRAGDPWVFTREAMSNTRAAIQAPMGTVTRIGWNGWPYGPATTVTGSLASSTRAATSDRGRVGVVAMGEHLLTMSRAMYPQSAHVTRVRQVGLAERP